MRKIFAGLVALLALLGGMFIAGPAQAYSNCPSASICFYSGYNGNTRIIDHDAQDRPGCFNMVPNDVMSSVDNNSNQPDHDIRVYPNSENCTGVSSLIYANTEGNMAGQWDNSINSYYVY